MSSTAIGANSSKGSRTILWCVPRAISTAFAKCLSFIDDIEVWFEPYTFSYAAQMEYCTKHKVPREEVPTKYEGNEEVFHEIKELLDLVTNSKHEVERLPYASVKSRLEKTAAKHVFVKDMAFGMTDGFHEFLPKGYRHTFLIRDPYRFLQSYRKAMHSQFSQVGLLEGEAADEKTYDVERDDRYFPPGYHMKEQYDLWKYLKEHDIDPNPIIIDGDDLLTKPAKTLKAYCDAVGLSYDDTLLEWDGSTAALKKMKASGDNLLRDLVNFYGTAMKSNKFLPPRDATPRDQLPPDVVRCADKVMKYFEAMYESRLKV